MINKYWVISLALTLVVAVSFSACTKKEDTSSAQNASMTAQGTAQAPTSMSAAPQPPTGMVAVTELKIEDVKPGTGVEAGPNHDVTVNYTGWLVDGKKFDSSLDHGQPFTFHMVPDGQQAGVIPGWNTGVRGMKVGGKRRLTIPPQLGYGERGAGGIIPPNATLVFEIDLLDVK